MFGHLRGILTLLILTVVVCCVLYPLALWGIGRAFFRGQAEGSLITKQGKLTINESDATGSRLIGQQFAGAGYFKPRPSNAGNGYDASLSGGSNWGASNIKLRDRVARLLGTTARFQSGESVGAAIEKWFADRTDPKNVKPGVTDLVTVWAANYPTLATAWVKGDPANADYVRNCEAYKDMVALWRAENKKEPNEEPNPEDMAKYFFPSFAKANPGKWPVATEQKSADGKIKLDDAGKPVKAIALVSADDDIKATFFEMWFQATKPNLEQVPADMVLSSGSGLDPHITLRNARYQAPGVIEERVKGVKSSLPENRLKEAVGKRVNDLIREHSFTPMWGLAGGDELINVLELNLALDEDLARLEFQ